MQRAAIELQSDNGEYEDCEENQEACVVDVVDGGFVVLLVVFLIVVMV